MLAYSNVFSLGNKETIEKLAGTSRPVTAFWSGRRHHANGLLRERKETSRGERSLGRENPSFVLRLFAALPRMHDAKITSPSVAADWLLPSQSLLIKDT